MTARFVLVLHSHLPWVLHHGRWPHGSDWLTEAAVDTYLPLLDVLHALQAEDVPSPISIGITPVLANQLAHPDFRVELRRFFAQRLEACAAAPASLARTGDKQLAPVVEFWRQRLTHLRDLFERLDGDLIAAFRALADAGRIELLSSAATHGFLPLLGTDESIRFQLRLGAAEHRRLFGRTATGCWMPECAYRPAGPWAPMAEAPGAGTVRKGIETFLADAGFRYVIVDAHLVAAGRPIDAYGAQASATAVDEDAPRTAYRPYRLTTAASPAPVDVLVRDPRTSQQVWSRFEGYPGDPGYLEFHKQRWPGGLKLWRVTGPGVDLGAKAPYDPAAARARAGDHARHFAHLLGEVVSRHAPADGVAVAPFDTELFGHWWFEGPEFIHDAYRELAASGAAVPATASAALAGAPVPERVSLPTGSWGANGDFSMWLGPATAWTWKRLWPLETRFWALARQAIDVPAKRPVLEQAARSLLLAQSSDWQFIISTGAAADYAERRFAGHTAELERLLDGLVPETPGAAVCDLAAEIRQRDDCFPDVLTTLAEVLRLPPA